MPIQKNISEEKLAKQLSAGCEKAFVQIYDLFWQPLFNHAYKRCPDQEIVQELIQDLFTELWQKRNQIKIQKSLSAYLYQSMKYKILNHIKAQIIRETYTDHVKAQSSPLSNEVEKVVLYNELDEAFKRAIALLPDQPKKVYQLKHDKGLSYLEISQKLKISVSTVEKHMIKALKILRENLKEYAIGSIVIFLLFKF